MADKVFKKGLFMGNGHPPGPLGIKGKSSHAPMNSKGLRGRGSKPGTLRSEDFFTHGPRLKGWPRNIIWKEFRAKGNL